MVSGLASGLEARGLSSLSLGRFAGCLRCGDIGLGHTACGQLSKRLLIHLEGVRLSVVLRGEVRRDGALVMMVHSLWMLATGLRGDLALSLVIGFGLVL